MTIAFAAAAGLLLGLRYRAFVLVIATPVLVIPATLVARSSGMSGRGGLAFVLICVIAMQAAYLAGLLLVARRR